jgi:serine/threonine-protein kinase RsbW
MAFLRNGAAFENPPQKHAEVHTLAEVHSFLTNLLAEMAQAGFGQREQFGVRLALEEAIINGIKHGNHEDPNKWVTIFYSIDSNGIITEIEDQGTGFNPNKIPNPLDPENLERPGGRGVFLIHQYMSFVEYNERGNRVLLVKTRGQ